VELESSGSNAAQNRDMTDIRGPIAKGSPKSIYLVIADVIKTDDRRCEFKVKPDFHIPKIVGSTIPNAGQ
jgi:hypothetical protein